MAKLIIERGPDKGLERECSPDEHTFIGRGKDLPLEIADQMASRRHCVVANHKGKWIIKDLGSANGTLLNGKPLSESKAMLLKHGDSVQIGETLITFEDAPTDTDPLINKTLGGYLIEERLGRGAMGVVYKARQISLNRDVALKILSSDIAHDSRFSDMFVKEARAAAALNNPNILQVYDVGKDGDHLFISMEIASGGSVLEELRRDGTIKLDRSVRIVKDALHALAYAEKRGIVHRDIKPDNLMIGMDDDIKLGDLGLAASSAELTGEEGGVFGTPHYIAPEQAQGKAVDHRADIYALGATWYRLLSGQTLFGGANVRDILRNQVRTPHRPLIDLMPEVPAAISAIIDRMLAKDPEERYQSATEVRADIELWERNRNVAGDAILASRTSREHPLIMEGENKQKLILIGGGVGLLVILAAVGFFVFGGDKEAPEPNRNGGSIAKTLNNDPDPTADSAEAVTKLEVAKALLNDGSPEGRRRGEASLIELIANWPESKSAVEAQTHLDQLAELDRASVMLEQSFRQRWDELIEKLKSEIAARYNSGAIIAAIDEFRAELKASPDARVQALDESLPFADARTDAEGHLRNFFRREQAAISSSVEGDVSLEALEEALGKLLELANLTDLEELKAGARALHRQILARFQQKSNALDAAEKARIGAAHDRALAAFIASATEVRASVRQLDFKMAESTLKAFEENNADYKADSGNPVFAELVQMVADRRQQTQEEFSAIRWLFTNWKSEAPVALPEGSLIREHFKDRWKLETIQFEMTGTSADDFTLTLVLDRRRELSPAEVKALPPQVLGEILRHGVALDSVKERISEDATFERYLAIGALLMEFDEYASAFGLFRDAYQALSVGGAKFSADHTRRVREFLAWAYLGRAKVAIDRGDYEEAEIYLDTLSKDFPETRAARR